MAGETESLISGPRPVDSVRSIHEALRYRQEEVPFPYLMGISGEAFRFFYNRLDPERGMSTPFHNPLRAVCKALGFAHELLYDETYETAWERLQGHISCGKLILLPFSDGCPFLVPGDQSNTVVCQNGRRKEFTCKQLQGKWQPVHGFLELGLNGYYQFVIGDREREPKPRETTLGAIRSARKMMRSRRRINDCAMGFEAYEELIAHLNGMVDGSRKLTRREKRKIARWNGQPLLQCLEARKAAVEYLQMVREHFEGEELEHLDQAIDSYQEVVTLLRELRMILPTASLLSEADPPPASQRSRRPGLFRPSLILAKVRRKWFKRFKPSCKAAIKQLKKIVDAETNGIRELGNVARVSEKLKM